MRWRVPGIEGRSSFWKEPKKIKQKSDQMVGKKCLLMKLLLVLEQEGSFQSPHYLQGFSSHSYLVKPFCSVLKI